MFQNLSKIILGLTLTSSAASAQQSTADPRPQATPNEIVKKQSNLLDELKPPGPPTVQIGELPPPNLPKLSLAEKRSVLITAADVESVFSEKRDFIPKDIVKLHDQIKASRASIDRFLDHNDVKEAICQVRDFRRKEEAYNNVINRVRKDHPERASLDHAFRRVNIGLSGIESSITDIKIARSITEKAEWKTYQACATFLNNRMGTIVRDYTIDLKNVQNELQRATLIDAAGRKLFSVNAMHLTGTNEMEVRVKDGAAKTIRSAKESLGAMLFGAPKIEIRTKFADTLLEGFDISLLPALHKQANLDPSLRISAEEQFTNALSRAVPLGAFEVILEHMELSDSVARNKKR